MISEPDIKYEDFFIDFEKFSIRPLEKGDFGHDFSTSQMLPDVAGTNQYFGEKPECAHLKLKGIYDFQDNDSGAFVVFNSSTSETSELQLLAYGLYAKNSVYMSHELFMTCSDRLKLTRLPKELLTMLIKHARLRGVKQLFATAPESNIYMRALAEKLGMSVRLSSQDTHRAIYSLSVDKHPDLIKF